MLPLDQLAKKMRDDRAAWGSLPWDAPLPARARGLLPATRVAEVFPTSFARLDPEGRVTLARLLTAADHEAFILFEDALVGALEAHHAKLSRHDPARAVLAQFALEEREHIAVFRRYLTTRLPEHAPARDLGDAYTFKPRLARHALVLGMERIAAITPASVYVFAELFELLTIRLARLLSEAQAADPDGVDPLLVAIHAAHAAEEGRHVAADKRFVGERPLGPIASHLALVVFALVALVEAASYRRVARRLVALHPPARALSSALASDARLTERTRLMTETVSRFRPTWSKLSPGALAPLYRVLILREPWRVR